MLWYIIYITSYNLIKAKNLLMYIFTFYIVRIEISKYMYYKYPFQAPLKKQKLLSGDRKNGFEYNVQYGRE